MDQKALFKFSYGLYVLTTRDGDVDNGCIINTAMQVTDTPLQITIVVNKANKTTEMIQKSGVFNINMINTDATFDLFKHFGFQSGKDVNKFEEFKDVERSENGVYYLTKASNAYVSGKVIKEIDLDSHIMFVCTVEDAKVLNDLDSVTYNYYQSTIKPKRKQPTNPTGKTVWVCKICGYVYEGEDLPADFICPWCKHGAIDFEKKTI